MQTASPAFAAHMLLADQKVAQRVLINLPAFQVDGVTAIPTSYEDVTDCITAIKGDVAATTNVPEGSLQISGYSAAGATLTLSGPLKQAAGVPTVESMTIYKLLNPNDASSPMFRLSRLGLTITLQEGRWVGGDAPEYITVGTLIIDTIACSNGTVTLTLIDGRNSLRGQATLPPVITGPPQNAGLTNEFAYDALLRSTPYLSRPALRSGCVLSVGCRASIWPEVGSYAAFDFSDPYLQPAFGPGLFGTALVPGVTGNEPGFTLKTPIAAGGSVFMEFWASGAFDISASDATGAAWLYDFEPVDATHVNVTVLSASGFAAGHTFTVADTLGFHYYGVLLNCSVGSAAVTVTLFYDGTTTSSSFTALDNRPSVTLTLASFGSSGTIEAVQMTTETSPASNGGFVPTLILDPSLNPLVALPDVSDKDIYGAIQEAVSAEAGVFVIDELNVAHFVNRETIAAKTSVLTLSSRVNLTGLDSLEQQSTQYTHIQVPVNQIQIGAYAIVWQSSTAIELAPNSTQTILANMDNIAVNVPTHDSGFLNDTGFWSYHNAYFMGCTTADGTGFPVALNVSFTVEQISAKSLRITITNAWSFPVFLVAPDGHPTSPGTPALVIGGQPVLSAANQITNASASVGGGVIADAQWPPVAFGGAASNPAGDVLLSVAANAWLQDLDAGQALADHYLSDFHVALPLIRNTTIVSDPRTQLLDRVTMADVDVSLANMDALIVGVHFTYGGGSGNGQFWTRNFDLRSCWPPGAWVLGVPGMSELGNGSTIPGTAYAY